MPPRSADPTLAPAALKAHARAARAAQLAAQADRDARERAHRLERIREITINTARDVLRLELTPQDVTITGSENCVERGHFTVDGISFTCRQEFGYYRLFLGESATGIRALEDLGAYLEGMERLERSERDQ